MRKARMFNHELSLKAVDADGHTAGVDSTGLSVSVAAPSPPSPPTYCRVNRNIFFFLLSSNY